mmetsp:Transcript_96868/g.276951  ORF Transcript_96868/g.276951 Transcript_96868/m.276951 type:complete len:408 (-) Transcript_96868:710-1933(-)
MLCCRVLHLVDGLLDCCVGLVGPVGAHREHGGRRVRSDGLEVVLHRQLGALPRPIELDPRQLAYPILVLAVEGDLHTALDLRGEVVALEEEGLERHRKIVEFERRARLYARGALHGHVYLLLFVHTRRDRFPLLLGLRRRYVSLRLEQGLDFAELRVHRLQLLRRLQVGRLDALQLLFLRVLRLLVEVVTQRSFQLKHRLLGQFEVPRESPRAEHFAYPPLLALLVNLFVHALERLLQPHEQRHGRLGTRRRDATGHEQQPVLNGRRPELHSLHVLVVDLAVLEQFDHDAKDACRSPDHGHVLTDLEKNSTDRDGDWPSHIRRRRERPAHACQDSRALNGAEVLLDIGGGRSELAWVHVLRAARDHLTDLVLILGPHRRHRLLHGCPRWTDELTSLVEGEPTDDTCA